MPSLLTPNMSLVVPIVGQEPGPQYATDINGDLSLLDSHNHTPGFGVPIPAAAINYNADISTLDNRLLLAKSVTFTAQVSPLSGITPDIGALYVSGVDLYYNDISGNQIRITQSGGVTGTPGSISGLTPPASASYIGLSQKFVWQSGVNISAGMDNGPITIRENTLNAKGITIQSPVSLAADYSLTLPAALPASTKFLTIDSSGNINDNIAYPLKKVDQAPVGQQVSASCGLFSTTSATNVDITNLSVTITTSGRPVVICFVQAQPATSSAITVSVPNNAGDIALLRGATIIYDQIIELVGSSALTQIDLPLSIIHHIDVVGAGTYTYKAQAAVSGGGTIEVDNATLFAYEL